MAIRAHHILLGMNAAADIGARKSLGVAAQTGGEGLLRSDFRECNNGRLAAVCLDVSFPGSVAAFAAGIFGRFLAAGDTLIMRITEELIKDRGVTSLASVTANVIGS